MPDTRSDFPSRLHRVEQTGRGEPAPCDPGRLVSGSADSTVWNVFTDTSGRFHVGHWSAEPGIRTVRYTETEFCLILKGRVRLDSTDGTAEFGPGDAFVIEAGFLGTWETLEPVTKLYVILDPEPIIIP